MDICAQVHVVVDLILHAEVSDAFRDDVLLIDELEFHRAFAPFGDLLTPRAAHEVLVEIGGGVVASDGAGVDYDEAAAARGELLDADFFVRLEVAARLTVDDEHVGAGEFFIRGEGLHAFDVGVADGNLHASRIQQGLPVARERWVVMVARAVALGAATEEDAERSRGISGKDRDDGQQG